MQAKTAFPNVYLIVGGKIKENPEKPCGHATLRCLFVSVFSYIVIN